jgi:chemotaxis response regulator CheB
MGGRNVAWLRPSSARPPTLPFDVTLGDAQRNVAKTVALALLGWLLSGPVMAEKRPLTGEGNLRPELVRTAAQETRSDTQDLQTTDLAAKPVSLAENSLTNTLSGILPLIVTSPERRQLGRDLERLLRQGKLEEAESRLNTAVEVGTLAILLLDQIRAPGILAELQALGVGDDTQSTGSSATAAGSVSLPIANSDKAVHVPTRDEFAELKAAKEREQQRADAISRDLATATEELRTLRALRAQDAASAAPNAEQWAELKASFEKERERADTVTRDLAVMAEERHAVQKLRGKDALLMASSRRELQELKQELERERQRNQTAAALSQKGEQLPSSKIGNPLPREPIALTGRTPATSPDTPASIPAQGAAAAVLASTGGLRGIASVLNTSTLSLLGRTIHLFGVETDGQAGSTDELARYLDGREVVCEPAGPADVYRCQVEQKDLSTVVLFNGGGWAAPDATPELMLAAGRARSSRVGVWSK